MLTKSILKDIREAVGLSPDTTDFDGDLIMHINGAIGKLNQNGVGRFMYITGPENSWGELVDPLQIEGNEYFQLVPLFVMLSTKLIFDPPPPSSVEYHSGSAKELLWRLKLAYEEPDIERYGGEYNIYGD